MRILVQIAVAVCAIILAVAAVLNLLYGSETFFLIPFLPIIFGAAVAYWFTAGSNWSIAPKCPNCGTQQPTWRWPASFRQMLWGGWTCTRCGTELDRHGRALSRKEGLSA